MQKITDIFVSLVKRYLPNPFSLAITLTVIVFVWGWGLGNSVADLTGYWGKGLFSSLAFIMQMVLILCTGYALAISPFVEKLLDRVCGIPKSRYGALVFVFLTAMLCAYINWGFALVAAAMICKKIAARNGSKKFDFPIMVAAAYSATQIPAFGSALILQVASPGHFLEDKIGLLSFAETLLAPANLAMMAVLIVSVIVLLRFIMPAPDKSIIVDPVLLAEEENDRAKLAEQRKQKGITAADKLDRFTPLSWFVAAMGALVIVNFFRTKGFIGLDTNTVILIFLTLGILAHGSPIAYVRAINSAITTCGGIVLQFPFYYGMMGLMTGSGVATALSNAFISISTPDTLPMYTFWSAGLLNLFIPSAGGQWAVQGPVMIEAGIHLGVSNAKVAMAVCWGDLWTNLIQPFWALPMLAIAKLDVKDIMGYCIMIGILEGVILSIGFLLW
jgi:Short chain fatty acids transporter